MKRIILKAAEIALMLVVGNLILTWAASLGWAVLTVAEDLLGGGR